MKMPAIAGIAVSTALLLACSPAGTPSPAGARPSRTLEAQTVKTKLHPPLPEGKAEALFYVDTGGDQMTTENPRKPRLFVVVRVGEDEYRQVIATCPDPARGSALGGGTERELEIAMCNGEYVLVSEPALVSVVPMKNGAEGKAAARFELPSGVRAVSPTEE